MIAWSQGKSREVRWLIAVGVELSQEISTNE